MSNFGKFVCAGCLKEFNKPNETDTRVSCDKCFEKFLKWLTSPPKNNIKGVDKNE